ncbi:hypothetical protein MSAN_01029200 [Mycena sanguinolenta]|uniref:F-box domain-containing protein n=1 Tax=Mycena sanguinolenta TaxID=230812 RepID=A0A8H7D648_9AGAR|nr:hypothetical protein MSAN_01029200 [Mycena sanguinolenta]
MPAQKTSLQTRPGAFNPADSSFFVLFEQDRVPSPGEKIMIQELLVEKTAYLANLNSQAPRRRSGKKMSRQLRAELDYTRAFIKFHRALISPWRRLPVEILSEIFLFTLKVRGGLRDIRDDELDPWVDDRAGTLLLCKICSAWRAVALRTPALWNTLSLQSYQVFRRPLDWVSTWLDRSRTSPLHLQLLWDPKLSPHTRNSVLEIFTSHLPHTTRLAVEEVQYADTEPEPSPDSEDSHPELPLIAPMWDWVHSASRASPHLTHLSTSQFYADSFPVVNLTHLYLGDPVPMPQVFQIFEHASNLQNVAFRVKGPAVACSPGALLGMKSVSKMEISSEDVGEFLERTAFPNLVNLAMSHIFPWPDAEFRSFLSRSSCALTGLGFFDCYVAQEKIIGTLQHSTCNTLETFYVDECAPSDADALLQYLTYHGPDRPLSNPKLRGIELHDIRALDGLLSTMVESRLFRNLVFVWTTSTDSAGKHFLLLCG